MPALNEWGEMIKENPVSRRQMMCSFPKVDKILMKLVSKCTSEPNGPIGSEEELWKIISSKKSNFTEFHHLKAIPVCVRVCDGTHATVFKCTLTTITVWRSETATLCGLNICTRREKRECVTSTSTLTSKLSLVEPFSSSRTGKFNTY